ncbi:MAG: hypothetical protein QG670_484, partial [Thermoproteota archaeon]|nr:hypothetical protein [Thermoproteota archaeon]
LHVNDADSWVLKLNEFQHDLRVFLKNGFKPNGSNNTIPAFSPPKTFENALTTTIAIIRASNTELAGEQGINHFNLFLAPFARNLSLEEIKDSLRRFLFNLNQTASMGGRPADVSLGLDFTVPENLEKLEAIGVRGDRMGFYGDYLSEASRILSVLLDLMFEDDAHQPIFSPYLIFNLNPENVKNKDIESLMLKAHELAAKRGTPYFVNSSLTYQKSPSYFATGSRMNSDWTGDWELDTIRTGNLGNIVINLPRLAYEAKGSDSKLLNALDEYLQMVIEALSIKYQAIEDRIKWSLLPFLSQPVSGEPYLRIRDNTLNINLVGLNEAVKVHTGNQLHEDKRAMDFGLKIMGNLALQSKAASWKSGFRVTVANDSANNASQRFAKLDIERYGWGTVFIQGSREAPYYTDLTMVPLEAELSLNERLDMEGAFHSFLNGGHLALIELEEPEQNPEMLLKMSRQLSQLSNIGFYAFTRSYSYCANCQKVFGRLLSKCPECASVKSFTRYSRLSSKYLPLNIWSSSKQGVVGKRHHYTLS